MKHPDERDDETKATEAYYDWCAKNMDCKIREWTSLHGSEPNDEDIERLKTMSRGSALTAMIWARERFEIGPNIEQVRSILKNKPDSPERDYELEKLSPGWIDRRPARDAALWDAALQAAETVDKGVFCYDGAVQADAFCYGVARIFAARVAGKVGSKFLGRFAKAAQAVANAERPALAATGENGAYRLSDVGRAAGLSNSQLAQLEKDLAGYSPEYVNQLTETLAKIGKGEPLTSQEAFRLANKLDRNRIRGVLAFHGTKQENLATIQNSGEVVPGLFHGRMFAFPFNPARGDTGGTAIGDGLIIFQGPAAKLFSDRIAKGIWSRSQRQASHLTTPLGRVIVDDSRMVNGSLVVTRAHMASQGLLRDTVGLSNDMGDLLSAVIPGGLAVVISKKILEGDGSIPPVPPF